MANIQAMRSEESLGKRFKDFLRTKPMVAQWIALIVGIIILFIIFYSINHNFISIENLKAIIIQLSIASIVAFGLTFVFISGNIDISVGSLAAFAAILSAWLMEHYGINPWLAILACIFCGIVVGVINGIFVTKLGVNSLIITLGMMSVLRGLANFIGNYLQINIFNRTIIILGAGKLFQIPIPFLIFLFLFIVLYFMQLKTKTSRFIYAVGANSRAAKLCGINVDNLKIGAFVLCSVLASFAGLMLAGRSFAAYSAAATGWEFNAIGAVVIGGTSLSGGKGSIVGTVVGALLMVVAANGMLILGMQYSAQLIVKGCIIIFAIWMDFQIRRSFLGSV